MEMDDAFSTRVCEPLLPGSKAGKSKPRYGEEHISPLALKGSSTPTHSTKDSYKRREKLDREAAKRHDVERLASIKQMNQDHAQAIRKANEDRPKKPKPLTKKQKQALINKLMARHRSKTA